MNLELCAIVRGPYGSYDCATVVSISDLSHNRTRALADEQLMFQSLDFRQIPIFDQGRNVGDAVLPSPRLSIECDPLF